MVYKKTTWASVGNIKANEANIKTFYAFMCEKEAIDVAEFKDLEESIKRRLPEWIETMKRYENPDIDDMDEVWGM